ncbi:OPT oligopeptide transporter protein-domain-containing protein [Dipodascopsis tothii]|uniref:OPT oligopeptide transporter protein-domain-containing protein n=1 Tax=Dipodascopsis tothii TaxID=44089 RepID=UPI0034CD02A1
MESKQNIAAVSAQELAADVAEKDAFELELPVPAEEVEAIRDTLRRRLGEFATEGVDDSDKIAYLTRLALELTGARALEILQRASADHADDVNFPEHTMAHILELVGGPAVAGLDLVAYDAAVRAEATLIDSFSPYPEVRSVIDPFDDPSIPVETVRAYVLGLIWVVIGAFVNSFFAWRQPQLKLQSTAIQLLLYPCGKLAQLLPDWGVTMFATLMVNVGASSSNFMNYVLIQRLPVYYGQEWVSAGYIIVLNLSSLIVGFGWAGLLRRWVIYPSRAIWPTVLPTLALNRALLVPERKTRVHGWSISRYRFFFVCFVGMFLYFFLPDYVFTALADFNWMTWIAPTNLKLALITGSFLGMGVNPVPTFDWSVINYFNPLVVPVFATVNNYVGMLCGGVVVVALYWTNYRWGAYLPINSNQLFSNMGVKFNVSRVLTDGLLDEDKYQAYSPPYMSSGNLVYLGAFLMMYTLSFLYTLATEWPMLRAAVRSFWQGLRNRKGSTYAQYGDPVSRLMTRYKEVPDWWFLALFVVSFAMFLAGVLTYPTKTPWWAIIVTTLVSFVMLVPITLIYAITGFDLRMNNLSSVISGYMLPGNGNANLMCRLIGINTDIQADTFVSDLKMAHYAKVPPRAAFRAQLLAVVVQCFVGVGVILFQIDNIENLCSSTQKDKFTCAGTTTIYADSVLFGVIGPRRVFDRLYPPLKYSFLIGVLIVPPMLLLRRWFPRQMRYVHPVLLANGAASWGSSYNLAYFTPGLYASLAFMWYVRRRYLAWWSKYNYVLTSAFSAGVALSGVVVFLAFEYKSVDLDWWGNTVSRAGVDGSKAGAILAIPDGGFGLRPGTY